MGDLTAEFSFLHRWYGTRPCEARKHATLERVQHKALKRVHNIKRTEGGRRSAKHQSTDPLTTKKRRAPHGARGPKRWLEFSSRACFFSSAT